mmetsp:Transcript_45146/g.88617  ORF Transcript_45146/g.88617 Transcript_45146/m.88617 type:complete len:717 (-) Transcript_45146:480-2630(-)
MPPQSSKYEVGGADGTEAPVPPSVPDKSSFQQVVRSRLKDPDQDRVEIEQLISHYRQILKDNQKWVINPDSTFAVYWDIVIFLCLIFTAIWTPFEVAFLHELKQGLFALNICIDLLFWGDMVVNFHLIYVDKKTGVVVKDKKLIAAKYLRGSFAIDLISCFPYDSLQFASGVSPQWIKVLKSLRMLKLLRLIRIGKIFSRWIVHFGLRHGSIKLAGFFVLLPWIAHIGACAWGLTVVIENNPVNWMSTFNINPNAVTEAYVASLYWATMTATTIGFGDIGPTTKVETLMATFLMFVGGCIYALMIGSVCGLLAKFDEATSQFREISDHLDEYMTEVDLPPLFQVHLRRYYQRAQAVFRAQHYKKVLTSMSPGLRRKFAGEIYGSAIRNMQVFSQSHLAKTREQEFEYQNFLSAISMKIENQAFPATEHLIHQGMLNQVVYIVQNGMVSMRGKIVKAGGSVGQDIVCAPFRRNYFATTLTHCSVMFFTKNDLTELLESGEYPVISARVRASGFRMSLLRTFLNFARFIRMIRDAYSQADLVPPENMTILHVLNKLRAASDLDMQTDSDVVKKAMRSLKKSRRKHTRVLREHQPTFSKNRRGSITSLHGMSVDLGRSLKPAAFAVPPNPPTNASADPSPVPMFEFDDQLQGDNGKVPVAGENVPQNEGQASASSAEHQAFNELDEIRDQLKQLTQLFAQKMQADGKFVGTAHEGTKDV